MNIVDSKFKKLLAITVLFVALLALPSCSDILDVNDPNRVTPDNFWADASDAEKGLVGAYGPLTTIQGWGRMMGAILTIHRGDIVDVNPQPNVYDIGTFTLTSEDARVVEGWQELNAIVQRSSDVLANVPDIDMDESRRSEILGEAYFLRGLAHFYLLNMWGNIPLVREPLTDLEQLRVEQAPSEEVWSSIKSDFEEAQDRLPEEWPESELGRASWGAATAMFGKAHLYTQEWEAAAAEFKKIIDSGIYDLVDDYQDNFLKSTNNNQESVFELQYESTPNGNWGRSGTENPMRGKAWEPDIAPPGYTSQQSVTVNQWVFDLFMRERTVDDEIDPRAFATLLWDYEGAKVYQESFDEAFSGEEKDNIYVRKYLDFDRTSSLTPGSWAYSDNNYRMIRFADVLLMFAEAENEASGPTNEVLNAVNRVRQRAGMPNISSGLTQAEMREAIREERVLELAIEGHRHLDLRRWGIMADRFLSNPQFRENAGMNFQEGKHEVLPIPQQDIDANPNLEQNPGY